MGGGAVQERSFTRSGGAHRNLLGKEVSYDLISVLVIGVNTYFKSSGNY